MTSRGCVTYRTNYFPDFFKKQNSQLDNELEDLIGLTFGEDDSETAGAAELEREEEEEEESEEYDATDAGTGDI